MNELKCKIGENLRTRLYNQSQNHPRHVLVTRKGLVKMSASEPWLAAPGELPLQCRNSGRRSLAVAESLGARPTAGQCWWCRQAEGGVCGGANAPHRNAASWTSRGQFVLPGFRDFAFLPQTNHYLLNIFRLVSVFIVCLVCWRFP